MVAFRFTLLFMASFVLLYAEPMHFEKAIFKVSYIRGGEKVQRLRLSVDRESLKQIASPDALRIDPTDSIACQASFLDDQEQPAAPAQVFFRIENKNTGKDNFYLLRKKGRDFKVDIKLTKEIKADLEFWRKDGSYRIQLVMGDSELDSSQTWTITENMIFSNETLAYTDHLKSSNPVSDPFQEPERNVFDFDISVKKSLLPEFISPVPAPEKRAHPAVVISAIIAVIVPILVLLFVWRKMNVFPLTISDGDNAGVLLGFEACVLCHIAALVMFWVKWNIVLTWQVMGVLMIPTYYLGQKMLLERTDE